MNYINHFYLPIVLFPSKFYVIPATIVNETKNFIMKFMDPYKAMHFSILSSDMNKGGLRNPIKDIEILNISILLKNYMTSKWKPKYLPNLKRFKVKTTSAQISGHIKAGTTFFEACNLKVDWHKLDKNPYKIMIDKTKPNQAWLKKIRK